MNRYVLVAFGLSVVMVALGAAPCTAGPAGEVVLYGDIANKPACADTPPGIADVSVNGQRLFVIPGAAAGYTAGERREIVETRVTEILSRRLLGPVRIGAIRGKPTIWVGPVRLVTVYPRDVRNSGAHSSWALAREWAEGTRRALPIVRPVQ